MYAPKLTHEERRDRRAKMVEAVHSGKTIREVAELFGVTTNTVRLACDHAGIPNYKVERRAKWIEEINGGKSTTDIAIENGVCVETVGRVCRRAGIKLKRGRPFVKGEVTPTAKWRAVDWTLRDTDIARMLSVTRQRVQQVRAILKKESSPLRYKRNKTIHLRAWMLSHRDDIEGLSAIQIAKDAPLKVTEKTVRDLAEELGITLGSVVSLLDLVTKDNLANFVDVNPQTACWEWKLSTFANKYPRIGVRDGKTVYGHRLAHELFKGPIPTGKWVLHTCDNPRCMNPEHLYIGTAEDNARDREEHGRGGSGKRMDEFSVRVIRQRFNAGERIADLADEYDRSYEAILNLVKGRSYRDVITEPSQAVALTA